MLMGLTGHQAVANEVERWQVNMTPGVTPVSQEIYGLHMLIFWICVAIGVLVFGALVYTMIAHRKSDKRKASQFHEHLGLEIFWTAVPFVILVLIAIPATRSMINLYDTDTDVDLDVVVTGYQWKWQYEYLGKDVSFFSNLDEDSNAARQLGSGIDPETVPNYLLEVDRPLVVPVNQKIRFLVTANDVIHSWWVPDLAIKRDAIPGFVREAWATIEEPGIYRGVCAELCGRDHGFMPIVVKAVEQEEFDNWLAQEQQAAAELRELAGQTFTFEDLYSRGEGVYNRSCAACHGANGQGVPGAFPAIAGSSVATGAVEDHLDVVVNGVPGTAMQAFGAQLSPVDIAAVVTFQRNAFGNDMGDQVQPVDVLQLNQ
ncbi:cytochrome c oxidase subunit II [Gilvimarinus sp. F26214L]|uniref:cytochrome c oxidase subunit II n=1 Tax=Gilvimarinus sp. DZF01 TaxID=3461371 RepID=UPI0040454215